MKKKYIIATLILILVFSCGKKNKRARNSQNNVTLENKMNDKIKELTEKAKKGDTEAQAELGEIYLQGDGIKADYKKSMEWSKKAAENKNYRAMRNIGILYLEGLGVKKDYKKAIEVGKKAIELYLRGEPKYYNYEFITTDLIHRIAKDLGQKPEETELTNDYEGRNFQLYILDAYIEQGNDKETFDYFFSNYQKFKDNIKYMGDMDYEYKEWIDEYIDSLKKINDKYKNKDKKFYEENLKKFKFLEL